MLAQKERRWVVLHVLLDCPIVYNYLLRLVILVSIPFQPETQLSGHPEEMSGDLWLPQTNDGEHNTLSDIQGVRNDHLLVEPDHD